MTTVAQLFGDEKLEQMLIRRFNTLLPHLVDNELAELIGTLCAAEYTPNIKLFRDLVALHIVREKLDRVWHASWKVIGQVV